MAVMAEMVRLAQVGTTVRLAARQVSVVAQAAQREDLCVPLAEVVAMAEVEAVKIKVAIKDTAGTVQAVAPGARRAGAVQAGLVEAEVRGCKRPVALTT